jgi:TonB family protein
MPATRLGLDSVLSRQTSFLRRIRENLQSVWTLPRVALAAPKWLREAAVDSAGKRGSGGDRNPLPPTAGELAPPSKIVFASPRLPDDRPHPLGLQMTTFDADAPELSPPVKDLGLPWMTARNNSAGPGTNGVGTQPGGGMGNGPGDGSGWGEGSQPYARTTTQVVCLRCPDPVYSDEARKAKVQGQVTMRVLVGADGRARDIQVTRGIGLGLDENAVLAVRSWQFIPARDQLGGLWRVGLRSRRSSGCSSRPCSGVFVRVANMRAKAL